MNLIYYVREAEVIPFGHGKICNSPSRPRMLETTLFPFNYLVKFWYWYLRKCNTQKWENKIIEGMRNAYWLGANGYEENELDKLIKNTVYCPICKKRMLKSSGDCISYGYPIQYYCSSDCYDKRCNKSKED